MKFGRVLACGVIALLAGAAPVAADALKDDAIARLAASHSPDVPQAVARLAVKQSGLAALRKQLAARGRAAGLGREWNDSQQEWQQAEAMIIPEIDALIRTRIEDPQWVRTVMSDTAALALNAEEADEIARHLSTPVGQEQLKVLDIKVLGEQLMFSYTFTNRIDDHMRGAESEYAQMQQAWADRDWKIVRNFDGDEGARRFGTQQPGVKYLKSLAIRGVGKLLHYIDQVCAEAVQRVGDSMASADPYIAGFRARTGK